MSIKTTTTDGHQVPAGLKEATRKAEHGIKAFMSFTKYLQEIIPEGDPDETILLGKLKEARFWFSEIVFRGHSVATAMVECGGCKEKRIERSKGGEHVH